LHQRYQQQYQHQQQHQQHHRQPQQQQQQQQQQSQAPPLQQLQFPHTRRMFKKETAQGTPPPKRQG
jgi:hypothetical protein